MTQAPLRVLIADDSPTIRRFLRSLIAEAPDLQVVGEAHDGQEALALAERLQPDIISMDILMPRLDGLAATEQIMHQHPRPIVIVSARIQGDEAANLAFQALKAGALAVLQTPPARSHPEFAARRDQFRTTLRAMARVSVVRRWTQTTPSQAVTRRSVAQTDRPQIIAIGASAGGPVALQEILSALPGDFPVPIAVVQHMADGFIEGMVRWLNDSTPLDIMLAKQGQVLRPGTVTVAGSGAHLMLARSGSSVTVVLNAEPDEGPYQPSVDRLFESAAQFGPQAVGLLLTGMGSDGAAGLLAMRRKGARTLVQDERSCVVYGMPGAAVALDAAEQIVPLSFIASTLLDLTQSVPSP
jgi:two-component system chemotaxis response regulator CheB